MRKVDGFQKGFYSFLYCGSLEFFTSFELYPPPLPSSHVPLLTDVPKCSCSSTLDQIQSPDTAAQLFPPGFPSAVGLGQLQKSFKGPPSSRKMHFVSHSCSGTTEKHPLQRCLCYFYKSFQQHLCSQVSPRPQGFFQCLLIINSCSSFGSLTSNPLSVISVLTVAASALLSDPSSVWLLPLLELCSADASWSELRAFAFLPPETAQIPLVLHWGF